MAAKPAAKDDRLREAELYLYHAANNLLYAWTELEHDDMHYTRLRELFDDVSALRCSMTSARQKKRRTDDQ